MKYQKLVDRSKYCLDMYEKTKEDKYLMEDYCINTLFECEHLKTYENIRNFAKEKGFNRVYDIGCGTGHQSEVFVNQNIEYVGIEQTKGLEFWNADKFKYIENTYPFKVYAYKSDLAISVLCLTWNCYLYEKEKTLREQCQALQRDFNQCLLYIANDKVETVKEYFKHHESLGGKLHYFYD